MHPGPSGLGFRVERRTLRRAQPVLHRTAGVGPSGPRVWARARIRKATAFGGNSYGEGAATSFTAFDPKHGRGYVCRGFTSPQAAARQPAKAGSCCLLPSSSATARHPSRRQQCPEHLSTRSLRPGYPSHLHAENVSRRLSSRLCALPVCCLLLFF
jgi:hypothetical protein